MQEQQRQAYLEAMGITSWVPKGVEVSEPKSVQPDAKAIGEDAFGPRKLSKV